MTEFQSLLTSAVTLRIPPSEAIRGLTAFATVDFDSNPAYVNYRNPIGEEVELHPNHLRNALNQFLAGQLSAKELRDWSLFITLNGHFRAPSPPADDEDWFDPMWDAVHDLAAPEIHGHITPDLVRQKLASLRRFDDDPSGRAA
jgi:hypothetical protein